MRIDVGAGYRAYVTQTGATVQLLLCGGDKSTQQADIKAAQKIVQALDAAKKAAAKKAAAKNKPTKKRQTKKK